MDDRLERCLQHTSALQIELRGTTSGEHGDGRLRARFVETLYGTTCQQAFCKVKQAFDPKGIMNPGVKLAGAQRVITASVLKVGVEAPDIPPEAERTLRRIEKEAQWDVDRLSLIPAPEGSAV